MAQGLGCAIKLRENEIASSDHGANVAAGIINCQQRALRSGILLQTDPRFAVCAQREQLYVSHISRCQNFCYLLLRPGCVRLRQSRDVLSNFERCGSRRRSRSGDDQRVRVISGIQLRVPVRMLIARQGLAFEKNIRQTSLPAVPALINRQTIEHRLVCCALPIYVERGIDPQSPFMHLVGAVFVLQITSHFLYKIRRQRIEIMRQIQLQWRVARFGSLAGSDLAILEHRIDDQIAAAQRTLGMNNRRIINRRLGQSRDQGRLFQRELFGRLAEIKLRRRLESVNPVPEIDLVCVQSEDLVLGKSPLDLDGQQRFLNLAMKRSIGGKKKIARQLHGERGGALYLAAGFDVAVSRSRDAPHIDPQVTIEVFVLGGNQGIAENLREILVRSHHPPLQRK